jgi:hypothetical protein
LFIKPVYGAVYETEQEVQKAWDDNKDFFIIGRGPYLNKRDFNNYCDPTLDSVEFVYKDLKVSINTGYFD